MAGTVVTYLHVSGTQTMAGSTKQDMNSLNHMLSDLLTRFSFHSSGEVVELKHKLLLSSLSIMFSLHILSSWMRSCHYCRATQLPTRMLECFFTTKCAFEERKPPCSFTWTGDGVDMVCVVTLCSPLTCWWKWLTLPAFITLCCSDLLRRLF